MTIRITLLSLVAAFAVATSGASIAFAQAGTPDATVSRNAPENGTTVAETIWTPYGPVVAITGSTPTSRVQQPPAKPTTATRTQQVQPTVVPVRTEPPVVATAERPRKACTSLLCANFPMLGVSY